jgi:hypothetical protein
MNFKYVYVIFLTALPISSYASLPDESSGSQKPLEVNGQSRNLNMMLVLRNDKDKIKFVRPRESYRDEITSENRTENSSGESTPTKEGKN